MTSNPLDYITVKGFKSIASIEKLVLRPINLVIGPNGSGKSNFIGVFAFLYAIREGRLRDYVTAAGGAEKVLHFGSKVTKEIYLHLSFSNEVNQYELQLAPTSDDGLYPSSETVYYWDKSRYPTRPHNAGLLSKQKGRRPALVARMDASRRGCGTALDGGGSITSTTPVRPHLCEKRRRWTTTISFVRMGRTSPHSFITFERGTGNLTT